ncbi:molybdopterin-synthase adenylyltransferase MoeB [Mucilaginibacter flavus]|uniref:molybdopterin-synthase adenylyltransferase MoeB n=1 Tax=Mucilaginibacter flavus TaxID=931504 RepID=UPI0025B33926|nr:molybdopterin-synthase adenylyltransferase MoeB [Mucilaginibacter flavus]MDN3580891.1 molybdopterin-synthase adenylyltransferase MoeB [Mucilaginibacter flavus]
MLEREELKRYSRQVILPELGMEGQQKLKAAKVLMIGAGGLGCPVLQYLAAAGVGTIGIVDDDVVDISNLHRQILYSTADIGKPKAKTAKQKLGLLNPFINIVAYQQRITNDNAAQLFKQYDLVIDGSDNFPTRYLVNDTCVALLKPLVFGSIFKFEGQVSVFNYQNGPNYRDVFPEPPPEDEVPNCSEIGVIGVLPGIIGTYMANEAIKVVCGIGETLSGRLLTIDALNNSTTVFKITAQQPTKSQLPVQEERPVGIVNDEIPIAVLNTWLTETPDSVYLVDVREDYEFEDHNIGGINISLYNLHDYISTFPTNKKLVFVCQTGKRSKMAVNIVKPHFKGEVFNLKEGIL